MYVCLDLQKGTSRILATVSFEACSVLDLFFKMFSVHKPLTRYSRQKKTCGYNTVYIFVPTGDESLASRSIVCRSQISLGRAKLTLTFYQARDFVLKASLYVSLLKRFIYIRDLE